MSITVRLWTKQDLINIMNFAKEEDHKYDLLATIFANKTTYSSEEINFYYKIHSKIKTYIVNFEDGSEEKHKAVSDESLIEFLRKEYRVNAIESIWEEIIEYRELELKILIFQKRL